MGHFFVQFLEYMCCFPVKGTTYCSEELSQEIPVYSLFGDNLCILGFKLVFAIFKFSLSIGLGLMVEK